MDPKHRDRIAFMRVCSGVYQQGMKMKHVRIGKEIRIADAVAFYGGRSQRGEEALAGDIIGLHNLRHYSDWRYLYRRRRFKKFWVFLTLHQNYFVVFT